jgi:hypothetical protein
MKYWFYSGVIHIAEVKIVFLCMINELHEKIAWKLVNLFCLREHNK